MDTMIHVSIEHQEGQLHEEDKPQRKTEPREDSIREAIDAAKIQIDLLVRLETLRCHCCSHTNRKYTRQGEFISNGKPWVFSGIFYILY